ncbi:MAG: 3-methyladenine DNA glycosylase [Verrucomicrobiota bacterium]
MIQISESEWRSLASDYESAMRPWFSGYRMRRSRQEKHPVHDFLFEYYQTKKQRVERWHPPVGRLLQGVTAGEFSWVSDFQECEGCIGFLEPESMETKVSERLKWIRSLIEAAYSRPSRFQCFGLHEWAMVYRSDEIRHESTPLRLSREAVAKVVESRKICCTHWDAFRFFTDAARPLNTMAPAHDRRYEMEQFGCIHFNMDLYKWCYKAFPWISSELTLECFNLALKAREIDMRASPYDVTLFDLQPILIETLEGSIEYQKEQAALSDAGRCLARKLMGELQSVLATVPCLEAVLS